MGNKAPNILDRLDIDSSTFIEFIEVGYVFCRLRALCNRELTFLFFNISINFKINKSL